MSIIFCLFLGINTGDAYADDDTWIDFSTATGSGGGSGGGARSCPNKVNWYYGNMDCQGGSWIYYKYVSTDGSDETGSFSFAPRSGNGSSISGSACSKAGGFWHLGYDLRYNSSKWPWTNPSGSGYNGNIHMEEEKWGHISQSSANMAHVANGSLSLNYWDSSGHTIIKNYFSGQNSLPSNHELGQRIYPNESNPNVYYEAETYGTLERVQKSYAEAREIAIGNGATNWPVWDDPDDFSNVGGLYAFCGAKDAGNVKKKATYQGTVKGHVSGYSVYFTYSLKRTDSELTFHPDNPYTANDDAGLETSGIFNSSNGMQVDFTGPTIDLTGIGQKATLCGYLDYSASITEEGEHTGGKASDCVTLSPEAPPAESAQGYTNVKVTVTGKSPVTNPTSTVTTAADGYYKVQFQHRVKRTESKGSARNLSWTTYADKGISSPNNNINFARGTGHSGGGTISSSWTTVVDYEEETMEGNLYPGEKREFCQHISFTYEHQYWGITGWRCGRWSCWPVYGWLWSESESVTGAQRCATVENKAIASACTVDGTSYAFDVTKSKQQMQNIAMMKVENFANPKNSSVKKSGASISGDLETIYAKPGDPIRFTYDLCAPGQLYAEYYNADSTNSVYKISGSVKRPTSTSYDESSAGKKYLFGDQSITVGDWAKVTNTGTGTDLTIKLGNTAFSSNPNNYSKKADNYRISQINSAFTSPNRTASNQYSCSASNVTKTPTVKDYQIPGRLSSDTGNCKSATYVGKSSDVGSTIKQTLEYSNKPNGGTKKVNGYVAIPYNYTSEFTTSNVSDAPLTAGQKFEVNLTVYFKDRLNSLVSNNSYGTHTKSTTIKTYYWIESPEASATSINNRVKSGGKYQGETSGGYITLGESDVASYTYTSVKYSESGKYYSTPTAFSVPFSVTLDDNIGVGAKVCAAIAVNPADSHDSPLISDAGSLSQNAALTESSNYWLTSKPTCRTVGKKPTFAVTNGNLYAYAGVDATTFRRSLSGTQLTFSSMSQFSAASATKAIAGFATGASTWGGSPLDTSESTCNFSALTLANANCKKSDLASLGIVNLPGSSAETSPAAIVRKIMNRYIPDSSVLSNYDSGKTSTGSDSKTSCKYDTDLGTYKAPEDKFYKCLSNGMAFAYTSKNTFSIGTDSDTKNSWNYSNNDEVKNEATVFYVPNGTLYIKKNLYYGKDAENFRELTTYSSLNSISQRIIIAKKIVIDPTVTNVSAWLIADEIVTCDKDIKDINVNACNQQLTVNGPVITKKLTLNRTYGSGANAQGMFSSDNANKQLVASPAEIFNIGPETYLWAYTQFTRTGQATTTYQRELAPRY